MDGAAKTDRRTAQECLPFPLRCAYVVRRRSTASAPALPGHFALSRLQAAHPADPKLRATVRVWLRRLRPKKWCGVKENMRALAFGKRAQKGKTRWTHA
jgi:hypothetical protein